MATVTIQKNILDRLPEVLITSNILSYFYPSEITELQGINKSFKDSISRNGKYIYSSCCHVSPHGKILKVSAFNPKLKDIFWYRDGKLHRDGDLPALIWADGSQYWFKHGKLHRDGDLPAQIHSNGTQLWYQHGKLHRDGDLPAAICSIGTQSWYQHGKRHRDGDLPALIRADGTHIWYKHGELHRDGYLCPVGFMSSCID
jgi:hypothetical protein